MFYQQLKNILKIMSAHTPSDKSETPLKRGHGIGYNMGKTMTDLSRRKFLKFLAVGAGAVAASQVIPSKSLFAQVQNINQANFQAPKNFPANRPYWDMPADQDSRQALSKSKKTLEYQLNAYHQPNEIYGKTTSHGGGSYDNPEIGQSDVDAAQAGTNHFTLDATGNNIINTEDATEIQNYLDKTIAYLQSHWNFLSRDEKLSWFTKMANIYTVDQKQYINGDENTRYVSGNFATEFILRLQGYNKELTDLLEGTRKEIPSKYNESLDLNGRGNIPIYFVVINKYNDDGIIVASHGINGALKGDNPLNINDWMLYDPQVNLLVSPGDWTGAIPFNSSINIYKLENFGGSSWGEDMPSRYLLGAIANTMKLLVFNVDENGNSSLDAWNPNLLTTKPTVSIGRESSVPESFLLGNNYPDPFNSNTKIPYEVYKETKMSLDLYDMKGRHIKNLEKGVKYPGSYIETLDASNLSSGQYLAVFKTPEGIQSEKISLVK